MRPIHTAVLIPTVLLLATAGHASAQTILNVERLQSEDVRGWHWGLEGEFSVSQGNTEYLDVLAGVVVGHRAPRDWIRGFTGFDYRSETGEGLERDEYLHLRYNHWFNDRLRSFHFAQYQSSRANLLQRRILLGSGLRYRLLDGRTTFDVGTGAMYEAEDLDAVRITDDHPIEPRVWRMANLLVATRRLTESVRLVGVGYVQPELGAVDDIRLLTDLSVLISLTENVDLTVRSEWRHDSRPPGGVVPNDVVVRTGFTFSLR